jgi:hypothetical protein
MVLARPLDALLEHGVELGQIIDLSYPLIEPLPAGDRNVAPGTGIEFEKQ